MRDLNFQIKTLCSQHTDKSFRTRSDRAKQLQLIANQLYALGFHQMHATSLKEKHVFALVAHWKEASLSDGAIKNRMANLRWWADKINKPLISKDNSHYGIGRRQYVTNIDKSAKLTAHQREKISDAYVQLSLLLQEAFGLRREEAIKFNPGYADKGTHLQLKGSWTKGGKPRVIPIQTTQQRVVLDQGHALAGKGSLIPPNKNFVQQLRVYERQTANAGLSKMHGLRHAYAQRRYEELTGILCPALGGPSKSAMSAKERADDFTARTLISKELGHERTQISAVYLGR
jgi:integrase